MCSDIRQSASGWINCAKGLFAAARRHSRYSFFGFTSLYFTYFRARHERPNQANVSGQRGENSGTRGGATLADSTGREGEGVDGDVRFNSQQRGTGGGREIKISRNKRT